jgi:hypothetical protein
MKFCVSAILVACLFLMSACVQTIESGPAATQGEFVQISIGGDGTGSDSSSLIIKPEKNAVDTAIWHLIPKGKYARLGLDSAYEDSLWITRFVVDSKVMGAYYDTLGFDRNQGLSWYQAILLCNFISKMDKRDTLYSYKLSNGIMSDIKWNRSSIGYRLPTHSELRTFYGSFAVRKKEPASVQEWTQDDFSTTLAVADSNPVFWENPDNARVVLDTSRNMILGEMPSRTSVQRSFRIVFALPEKY